MINSTQQSVDFLGHQIDCVQDAYGTPHVPLKSLCDILGIDHNRQRRKIKDNGLFNTTTVCVKGADGRHRNMLCLPLSRIPDWASTIEINTLMPEVAEALTELLEASNEASEGCESQAETSNPQLHEVAPEKGRREQVYNCLGNLNWFLDAFLLWAREMAENNGDYFPGDEQIIKASPEALKEYVRKIRCDIRVLQAIIDASLHYENMDDPVDEQGLTELYNESLKLYWSTDELIHGFNCGQTHSQPSDHSYLDYLSGPGLDTLAHFGCDVWIDFQEKIIPRKKS